jgi:hypothetical protein
MRRSKNKLLILSDVLPATKREGGGSGSVSGKTTNQDLANLAYHSQAIQIVTAALRIGSNFRKRTQTLVLQE